MSTYKIKDGLSLEEVIRLVQILTADEENTQRNLGASLHSRKSDICVLKMNFELQTLSLEKGKIKSINFSEPTKLIDDILSELRKISYQIYPKLIEQMGFIKYLGSYVTDLAESGRYKIQFNFPNDKIKMSNASEVGVFRLCVDILSIFGMTGNPNLSLTVTVDAKVFHLCFMSNKDIPETLETTNKLEVIKARMLLLDVLVSSETNWRNCFRFNVS